jgi:hypothetical protein
VAPPRTHGLATHRPPVHVLSATELSVRLSSSETERDRALLSDVWSAAVSESFVFGTEADSKLLDGLAWLTFI